MANIPPRPKTAFIFAGGGSFGAIQVGMLRALTRRGMTADMVVGSSVGALNGAYYAGNPTAAGVERLEAIWRGLRRRDVFPLRLKAMLSFLYRRDFLVASDGLHRLVERNLAYRNLEDAAIPIHIVATNILTGGTVVLSEGSAAQAIIASAAIPAAFAPVNFNGLYLADGAVSSNTPIKVAVEQGAQRLIVLPTGYACALDKPPVGMIANALHALTLLVVRQLWSELETLDKSIDFFILPPLCPLVGSPYDFSQTAELIERAARSTDDWIANGGFEWPGVYSQLSTHTHAHQH
ncbi:patatin-like phospholipase family protein [Rhizobium sp. KVB221]|uniref:Patatin-like phospholipase family protein n=1 Tax=Rhizobium setariae TaxID=2801340 RepID=A0A936YV27_9HYPH|nr:patatin-like phospholipase family protein [Rhizobium setariae]MBL0373677.1 patatin-like phospholipase family protein [Rhizobium setariae]